MWLAGAEASSDSTGPSVPVVLLETRFKVRILITQPGPCCLAGTFLSGQSVYCKPGNFRERFIFTTACNSENKTCEKTWRFENFVVFSIWCESQRKLKGAIISGYLVLLRAQWATYDTTYVLRYFITCRRRGTTLRQIFIRPHKKS
jgi:hypothetical protein